MNTLSASRPTDARPIDPDWTIADLLDWLSDDARQHDPALRHPLARIEALITGAQWATTPSTVALIRSLVDAVRAAPELRNLRIRDAVSQDARELPALTDGIPQLV